MAKAAKCITCLALHAPGVAGQCEACKAMMRLANAAKRGLPKRSTKKVYGVRHSRHKKTSHLLDD